MTDSLILSAHICPSTQLKISFPRADLPRNRHCTAVHSYPPGKPVAKGNGQFPRALPRHTFDSREETEAHDSIKTSAKLSVNGDLGWSRHGWLTGALDPVRKILYLSHCDVMIECSHRQLGINQSGVNNPMKSLETSPRLTTSLPEMVRRHGRKESEVSGLSWSMRWTSIWTVF